MCTCKSCIYNLLTEVGMKNIASDMFSLVLENVRLVNLALQVSVKLIVHIFNAFSTILSFHVVFWLLKTTKSRCKS